MISLIILWIIVLSCFTLFGSWYARKYNRVDALVGLYVAFVLAGNLIAYKIAEFDLGFTSFYASTTVLIFSITFLLTDIVNEKFGRKETQRMIFIAFLTQIAIAAFVFISISLKPAPFWQGQEVFAQVIGFVPRIMIASWVAFLISESFDAYVFDIFKKWTKGKHLWMRNAFSSIPSMALDTFIFTTIAFYGLQPLAPLMLGFLVVKWLVGIVDIPFMYLNRWVMYNK